jgi:hypothetical protein
MTDSSHQMHQDRESLPERVELARRKAPDYQGRSIILVFLPWNNVTPFVTWAENEKGQTFWGHYHRTLAAALEDFTER